VRIQQPRGRAATLTAAAIGDVIPSFGGYGADHCGPDSHLMEPFTH
jgi:hypothetical protein